MSDPYLDHGITREELLQFRADLGSAGLDVSCLSDEALFEFVAERFSELCLWAEVVWGEADSLLHGDGASALPRRLISLLGEPTRN